MPRINIRYDASIVDAAEPRHTHARAGRAGRPAVLHDAEKVVVELFEQSRYSLGHRTLDVEISALPDPEGRRDGRIETFALEMVRPAPAGSSSEDWRAPSEPRPGSSPRALSPGHPPEKPLR